jgi:hypothetical protein
MATMAYTGCEYRCRPHRRKARHGTSARLLIAAVALAAALLIGYGEAWMFEQPRSADPQVTAAAYAVAIVSGDAEDDAQ